jgi:hypothetical protein
MLMLMLLLALWAGRCRGTVSVLMPCRTARGVQETAGAALQNTTIDEAEAEPLGSGSTDDARAHRTRRGYSEFGARQ